MEIPAAACEMIMKLVIAPSSSPHPPPSPLPPPTPPMPYPNPTHLGYFSIYRAKVCLSYLLPVWCPCEANNVTSIYLFLYGSRPLPVVFGRLLQCNIENFIYTRHSYILALKVDGQLY